MKKYYYPRTDENGQYNPDTLCTSGITPVQHMADARRYANYRARAIEWRDKANRYTQPWRRARARKEMRKAAVAMRCCLANVIYNGGVVL